MISLLSKCLRSNFDITLILEREYEYSKSKPVSRGFLEKTFNKEVAFVSTRDLF